MSYWGTIKPRRRKLMGKQKILYSDMDTPMQDGKVNQVEKEQFLEAFKLKKEKEKKQRLVLMLVIVVAGILAVSLLFILKVD